MRVQPKPWIGVLVLVGYVVIVGAVQLSSGIPYTELGSSAQHVMRSAVLSFAVGGAYLAIVTTALGWWRPALHDRHRSVRRWPVVAPAFMALVALLNLAQTDWSAFDVSFVVALLLLGVGVGFCEELVSRGVLLVALRARYREVLVWLFSSLLFGGMHLLNVVLGAPVGGTLAQVVLAAASGTAFYVLRRVTGSLVWAMLLHGLWDVSVFAVGFASTGTPVGGLLTPLVGLLAVVVVAWVVRDADERTAA